MQILETRRVRLELDAGSFDNAVDRLTNKSIRIWKRNNVRFEISAFLDLKGQAPAAGKEVDISEWESLTLEVKTSDGSGNLLAATTTEFDETLTASTWLDLTKQHAAVEFDEAETNVAAGSYDGVVYVFTTTGAQITLGIFKLQVIDSRAGFSADPPPANPGSAISFAQADARYLPTPVQEVADEAARLALTDLLIGRRVRQADRPTVIWFYEGGGEADPDNWTPYVATNEDGDIVADIVLPNTSGIVPAAGVLGRYGDNLVVGDGVTLNGNLLGRPYRNGNKFEVTLGSPNQLSSGTAVAIKAATTSGSYKVCWWDNSVTTHTSGSVASKTPSSDEEHAPKRVSIYPATGTSEIVQLTVRGTDVIEFMGGVGALTYLSLPNDRTLPFLDVSRYANTLTVLKCGGVLDQENVFGLERASALTTLSIAFANPDFSRLEGLVSLQGIGIGYVQDSSEDNGHLGEQMVSFTSGNLPSLTTIWFSFRAINLMAFEVSQFANLNAVWWPDRAPFWLDEAACEEFFESLPDRSATTGGYIEWVNDEPAGDTAIATAKNWTVAQGA